MEILRMQPSSTLQKPTDDKMIAYAWKPLYNVGAVAALILVALILIQMLIFISWPPPSTVIGYFTLFHNNWLLGSPREGSFDCVLPWYRER